MPSRVLVISLLGLVALPALLVFCSLQIKKGQVRHEIKEQLIEGMDHKDLETLTFDRKKIDAVVRWEHEREFEFRGQMYDVVQQESCGDSITFLCWPDNEETRLNHLLSALTLKALADEPFDRTSHDRLVNFLKSLGSISADDDGRMIASYCRDQVCTYSDRFSKWDNPPPTPPPDLALLRYS